MNDYAQFYSIYTNAWFRLARLFFLGFLIVLFVFYITNSLFPFFPVFFLTAFVMVEATTFFKMRRLMPLLTVSNNSKRQILDSSTLVVVSLFLQNNTSKKIIKKLLQVSSVGFMLQKADIVKNEISFVEVSKETILQTAFNIVKKINGKYITTIDIFAAYMLLIEENSKLLFRKNLKEDEFLDLLYWTRLEFPLEENPKSIRVYFTGQGIGEEWVHGWTIETKKYVEDITAKVISSPTTFAGRDEIYKKAVESLLKPERNSILLVGEAGVGKNSLVEALAYESYCGNLGSTLFHQRVFELLIGLLLAGANNQGELEKRIQDTMEELLHAENVLIYIPEFQNILGASTFNLDLSGALIPYIKKGSLRFIGTISPANFKKYLENKSTFLDLFEVITIEEPSTQEVIYMMLRTAKTLEKKYNVILTYRAITASVKLAEKYIQNKMLPGGSMVLLEDTANGVFLSKRKIVQEEDVVLKVEEKTHAGVAAPKPEEKKLLLQLEEELQQRIIGQEEAIEAISNGLRRIRSGFQASNKPVSFLFLGPTGVGKTETAKALADIYFKGQKNMIRLDMSEYTNKDSIKKLLGSSFGEGDERGELTEKVYEHPFSLILLDEFEKAHPEVRDIFLQILEDGRVTDNKGKLVSFTNTIIIATSNAASEFIREQTKKQNKNGNIKHALFEYLQVNGLFKPELLNRFDDIIVFHALNPNEIQQVTNLLLEEVVKKMKERDVFITFDEKITKKIAQEAYDIQFGARPIRRFIQDNIENFLSKKMLTDEVKRGDKLTFSTDNTGIITLYIAT